jgi:CRISPR system Cascade subunit CasA
LIAHRTGSKSRRIAAEELHGLTGDPWTPIDPAAEALTVRARGFHHKLACDLLLDKKYHPAATQTLLDDDGDEGVVMLAQAVVRGKGKTEGYHERRIPISRQMRIAFRTKNTDAVAEVAQQRIDAIAEIRKQLWLALCTLFNNGESDASDSVKKQASRFSEPFEKTEDARFFDDLVLQIESATPEAEYERWLLDLAERARNILRAAFDAGPRSGMRRYRAQSGALNKFDRALRSDKSPLKTLARLYRERSESKIPQETFDVYN